MYVTSRDRLFTFLKGLAVKAPLLSLTKDGLSVAKESLSSPGINSSAKKGDCRTPAVSLSFTSFLKRCTFKDRFSGGYHLNSPIRT